MGAHLYCGARGVMAARPVVAARPAERGPSDAPAPPPSPSRSQRGITGLETAIILIAFVIMGSVFAFTVLSTGVFTSERAKQTVFSAIADTSNSLSPRGTATAFAARLGGEDTVYKVTFVVTSTMSGQPIDLTPPATMDKAGVDPDISVGAQYTMVISYVDDNHFVSDVPWTVRFLGASSDDTVLEGNEKAEITVWLFDFDNDNPTGDDALAYSANGGIDSGPLVTANKRFSLEVKPARGAALAVERVLPPALRGVMTLR